MMRLLTTSAEEYIRWDVVYSSGLASARDDVVRLYSAWQVKREDIIDKLKSYINSS